MGKARSSVYPTFDLHHPRAIIRFSDIMSLVANNNLSKVALSFHTLKVQYLYQHQSTLEIQTEIVPQLFDIEGQKFELEALRDIVIANGAVDQESAPQS